MYPTSVIHFFLPINLVFLYQLVIKCSTVLFILKQVFNIDTTCYIILSLDTYLPVDFDYAIPIIWNVTN